MTFEEFFIIWLLCWQGVEIQANDLSCSGSNVKFTEIKNRCYWCLGAADLAVGEKSCETCGGTIFAFESLGEALSIKSQLNISETTEIYMGAIFNDVNGSQFYDWLYAPGTQSELLSNLSALGIGNTTIKCLLVEKEIEAVDCDKEMKTTICMRDITTDAPCSTSLQTTPFETTVTVTNGPTNTTPTTNNFSMTTRAGSSANTQKPHTVTDVSMVTTSATSALHVNGTSTRSIINVTTDAETTTSNKNVTNTEGIKEILTTTLRTTGSKDKYTTTVSPSDDSVAGYQPTSIKPAIQNDVKTTLQLHAGQKYPLLTQDHIDQTNNTTPMLNLSEIIAVPGKNRSMTLGNLLTDVISKTKQTKNVTTNNNVMHSTSLPSTRYCDDEEEYTDVNEHLGDILQINGQNGTKLTNFSNILDHVVLHANRTTNPCIKHPVSGLGTGDGGYQHKGNKTDKFPVTEVKFQVSALNPGSIPFWPGDPKIPDFPVANQQIMSVLRNASEELTELREEKYVTNSTFQKLAGLLETVVTNDDIHQASDKLKTNLLDDIMMTAENLVAQIQCPCQRLHVKSEVLDGDVPRSTSYGVYISQLIRFARVSSHVDDIITRNKVLTAKLLKQGYRYDKLQVDSRIVDVRNDLNETSVEIRDNGKHSITLAMEIFDPSTDTRVSTIEYKKMNDIMAQSDARISSHVMSVSVQRVVKNATEKLDVIGMAGAIILVLETFIVPEKTEDSRLCTFWDFDSRNWSSSGCQLLGSNATHTKCTCDHLTNFAVLVMYLDREQVSLQSQQVLLTLTTVGCSLSIACLAMTLIAFAYLRMLGNEKILIHFNLSLALVFAQIVFVSSSDAHTSPIACKVVAILLHFFFMASFTWMLVEGVALYLLCTKGFMNHRDMRIKYFLLGWGVPTVIVVVSLAAKFPNYGHGPQYSCWLSVQDGLIWAFLGPMLAIVVMNMFVMGLVVRKFLRLKAIAQKTEVAKLRGSLRAMMTLLPLLGLTWLLSLLVPFSVVFHYFFVIINTLQGMCIFFLHCICNDELRKKFQAKRRRWSSPTRTGSDSDTRYTGRRKVGSFDDVAVVATTADDAARKYGWA